MIWLRKTTSRTQNVHLDSESPDIQVSPGKDWDHLNVYKDKREAGVAEVY